MAFQEVFQIYSKLRDYTQNSFEVWNDSPTSFLSKLKDKEITPKIASK